MNQEGFLQHRWPVRWAAGSSVNVAVVRVQYVNLLRKARVKHSKDFFQQWDSGIGCEKANTSTKIT